MCKGCQQSIQLNQYSENNKVISEQLFRDKQRRVPVKTGIYVKHKAGLDTFGTDHFSYFHLLLHNLCKYM
jgi:hypothetical protein